MHDERYNIKRSLFRHLKKELAFWSYDPKSVTLARMSDSLFIEKVMYHLDCDDVVRLFEIYPKALIKNVWKNNLCPLGKYFDRMNYFYAVVFFGIKKAALMPLILSPMCGGWAPCRSFSMTRE